MKTRLEALKEIAIIHVDERFGPQDASMLGQVLQKMGDSGIKFVIVDLTRAVVDESANKVLLGLKQKFKPPAAVKLYLLSGEKLVADSSNMEFLMKRIPSPFAAEFIERSRLHSEILELEKRKKTLDERERTNPVNSESVEEIERSNNVLRRKLVALHGLYSFISKNVLARAEELRNLAQSGQQLGDADGKFQPQESDADTDGRDKNFKALLMKGLEDLKVIK